MVVVGSFFYFDEDRKDDYCLPRDRLIACANLRRMRYFSWPDDVIRPRSLRPSLASSMVFDERRRRFWEYASCTEYTGQGMTLKLEIP